MSARYERLLVGLLTDPASMDVLGRERPDPDLVPTEQVRQVYEWALDYYGRSRKPPTLEALQERWGEMLQDLEIDPEAEVGESIDYVLDGLRDDFVQRTCHALTRTGSIEVAEAAPEDKVAVFESLAGRFAAAAMTLQPRTNLVDFRTGGADFLSQYDDVAATPAGELRGMGLGLTAVNAYTGGILDGELDIIAAPPKAGKSFFADKVAYEEWRRGRNTAIYTLENSILTTQQRIACFALHLDLMRLQRGQLTPQERAQLEEWINDELLKSDNQLVIAQPDSALQTPQSIVAQARAFEIESLIIDQLTFLEPAKSRAGYKHHDDVRTVLRDLKRSLTSGRRPLPCLLVHQINREGEESAERNGRLIARNMAESSETERVVDGSFGLYASGDMRLAHQATLQMLNHRRVPTRDFDLLVRVNDGVITVRNDVPGMADL
jgi:replicative DNA helicase